MAEKRHLKTPPEITLLCGKYLNFIRFIKSSSPQTLRSYRSDLSQAFALSPLEIETYSGQDSHLPVGLKLETEPLLQLCRAAQSHWKELGPASRNRKTACLKSFLNWLLENAVIDRDLASLLHSPKVPVRLPHHLSVDEILALLAAMDRDLKQALNDPSHRDTVATLYRDRALILLLYGGGLRVSEACGLEWSRVNSAQRSIRVLGKGAKERLVVLPPKSFAALKALKHGTRYVFGEAPLSTRLAYSIVKLRGERAGLLQPLHPHALRHSFATHLLSSGANLRSLQELLGHSTLQATQRYTHIGVDQLARTLEAFHPFGNEQKKSKL